MLPIVIVLLAIFALQIWNRHGKGKKIAPAQIFKAHKVAGVLFLAVFLVHGLPRLVSGWAPFPNALSGALIVVALVSAVTCGVLTASAKGARRKRFAAAHKVSAAAAFVLLIAHVVVAIA